MTVQVIHTTVPINKQYNLVVVKAYVLMLTRWEGNHRSGSVLAKHYIVTCIWFNNYL